jgi:cysteine desulfurase
MAFINLNHQDISEIQASVRAAMEPYLAGPQSSPAAHGAPGDRAAALLERAREAVGALAGGTPEGVVFTASGSEAVNLAVKGLAWASETGHRILASPVESLSVRNAVRFLEGHGFRAEELPADGAGLVDSESVRAGLAGGGVALVAVTAASGEIGTVEPLAEIGALCEEAAAPLVVDAVHAAGRVPLEAESWRAAAVALSAHTVGGPLGCGALWLRPRTRLVPLIHGGIQEGGLRGGEENLAGIAGFAEAVRGVVAALPDRIDRLRRTGALLRRTLLDPDLGLTPTGHPERRLPGHLSVLAGGVDGEAVVAGLALRGVAASTGSSCTRAGLGSRTLTALGVEPALARGALAFTAGPATRRAEIAAARDALAVVLDGLRRLSPL